MKSVVMQYPRIVIPLVDRGFYTKSHKLLEAAGARLISVVHEVGQACCRELDRDPVAHSSCRIKTAASAQKKLEQMGHSPTEYAALEHLHDLLGVRLVCTYIDDVYALRDAFLRCADFSPVQVKDYIRTPKPNGYRSLHLIGELFLGDVAIQVEIQLRTLAMDAWATLEHQLRYKSDVVVSPLLVGELKRCADEMASTDWNLQSIRDMTQGEDGVPI